MKTDTPMRIPKIIHQMWKTSDVPSTWRALAESWKRHHPDWEYRLWTDEDCRRLVVERYPSLLPVYDAYSYNIQRADAARYLILHAMGGVYADLDMECLKPLATLLESHAFVAALEPACHEKNLGEKNVACNAFMASVPGHRLLATIADDLAKTRPVITLHREVLNTTGPLMLTRVIRQLGADAAVTLLPSSSVYPIANNTPQQESLMAGGFPAQALRDQLVRDGSYAIHYWANSWVRTLAGELVNPLPYHVPGYRFYPGRDAPGGDMRNAGRNVAALARECDADARLVAFSTDGFLKCRLSYPWKWHRMRPVGPGEGLYIKNSVHPLWVHLAKDFGRRVWRILARNGDTGS